MSTFLITGGAGFIGSHLAERCLMLGHPVVVLDDLSQGRRENVAHLVAQPRFAIVEASACDRQALDEHVAQAAVIFHLAASSVLAADGTAGRIALQQNHNATAAVLEAAARFDKRVVLASSGEVYQDNQLTAYVESDPVDPPTADHQQALCSSSKIAGERLAEESSADTAVARLFPTIGPRFGFGLGGEIGRFILDNMLKVLRRQAIVVDGELPQRISTVDVSDTPQRGMGRF